MPMRQWAVNDKAVPPTLNRAMNACRHCQREFKVTENVNAVCSYHAEALDNYAREIGAPPPDLKRTALRLHYTAYLDDDAPSQDFGLLKDKQEARLNGGKL